MENIIVKASTASDQSQVLALETTLSELSIAELEERLEFEPTIKYTCSVSVPEP
jgi:hypothetical protein